MEESEKPKVQIRGINESYNGIDYGLEQDEFLIGRLPECDLVMKEHTISAKHAVIRRINDQYEVEDLGSTNGTSVNGEKITKKTLRTEDVIGFDIYEFRFIDHRDVKRTVFSSTLPPPPKKTVLRDQPPQPAPQPEPPAAPQPQAAPPPPPPAQPQAPQPQAAASPPPPAQPQPPVQPYRAPQRSYSGSGRGSLAPGLILGLLMALIINYAVPFLVSLASQSKMTQIENLIKQILGWFPFYHLVPFYAQLPALHWSMVVVLICVPVGLMAGGFIMQKTSRGDRLRNSLVFSIFYVIIGFVVQLAVVEFQFRGLCRLFSKMSGLGMQSGEGAYLISLIIMFVTVFLFSFLGTCLHRPRY